MENDISRITLLHRQWLGENGPIDMPGFVGYWLDAYELRDGKYVIVRTSPYLDAKSNAILRYDISGQTGPLYDDSETVSKPAYSPEEIGKMKRIR